MSSSPEQMRKLLALGRPLWSAGAHDALSARLAAAGGFDFIVSSGFGISASYLAKPDIDLYSCTENATIVKAMCRASPIPIIADVDTGYGDVHHLARTVQEFESAGAAGVVIEDQRYPKQCPLLPGDVEVAPVEQACERLAAAMESRSNPEFLMVARTDAKGQDVLDRCRRYQSLGVDVIHASSGAVKDLAELQVLRQAIHLPLSVPLLGWMADPLSRQVIASQADLLCFPLAGLQAAAAAMASEFRALRYGGRTESACMPVPELLKHLGWVELQAFKDKVASRISNAAQEFSQ